MGYTILKKRSWQNNLVTNCLLVLNSRPHFAKLPSLTHSHLVSSFQVAPYLHTKHQTEKLNVESCHLRMEYRLYGKVVHTLSVQYLLSQHPHLYLFIYRLILIILTSHIALLNSPICSNCLCLFFLQYPVSIEEGFI